MKLLFGVIFLMLSSVSSPHNLTTDIYSHLQTTTIPNTITLESPYPIYPSDQMSYMKVYAPDTTEISIGDPRYINRNSMDIPLSSSSRNEYGTYAIYWRILDKDDLTLREGITTFEVTPPSVCDYPATILLACLLLCLYVLYREVEGWRSRHHSALPPLK